MALFKFIILCGTATLAFGQRGSFAGKRPIGYPIPENITTTTEGLGNRFGEDGVTTQRLPVEALGDRDLYNRISKLPVDQQPFWYLNWQALEAQRRNPQTYPQKPAQFLPSDQPSPNVANTLVNRNSESNLGRSAQANTEVSKGNGVVDRVVENKNKVANVHQSTVQELPEQTTTKKNS